MSEREADGRDWLRIAAYAGGALGGLVLLVVVLFVLGVLGIPDGGIEDNRWGEVDGQEIEIITEIGIENPNPFGIAGKAAAEYDIALQRVELARGAGTGITVDSGQTVTNFTTTLDAGRLPAWWRAHLNNDEVSILTADTTVDASVGPLSGAHDTTIEDEINTDIEGALDEASSQFEGAYPEGTPLLVIEEVTTEWGEVTEQRTEIRTTFEFRNPNEGTVLVLPGSGFAGKMAFNEITMAEWQTDEVTVVDEDGQKSTGEDILIEGGETERRTLVVEMANERIGEWFPTHIQREETTDVLWASELVVEVKEDDSLGDVTGDVPASELPAQLRIPPGEATADCDLEMQTGIFVEQQTDVQFQGCVPPTTVESGDITPTDPDTGLP